MHTPRDLARHILSRVNRPAETNEVTDVPVIPETHDPLDDFPVDAWTAPEYPAWFERHKCSEKELAEQKVLAKALADQPMFSIIVPLYETPLLFFRQMTDSVLAQTYENFELVLVNASPEDEALRQEVEQYCTRDKRMRVVELEKNFGITENTNYGIDAARGDFCCFLDHDDVIEPSLLFEYARVIDEDPTTDYLYCDEDMVRWDGAAGRFVHMNPLFKPGYSPELLLCKNYIIHMMTIRKSIIEAMPRPDSRFDGSQDYNMTLFATSHARSVHNVEKVLYHWRVSENSTATNPESKPYTIRSCRLAMEGYFDRQGLNASIIGTDIYDLYNPWFAPTDKSVSVVVDCGHGAYATTRFLEFLRQSGSYPSLEVVLVNPEGGWQQEIPGGVAVQEVSSAADNLYQRLNEGASAAIGDCLLFMDTNSAFVTPEALSQMAAMCSTGEVACVGPKVLYRGGFNKSFGAAITSAGVFPLYRGYEDSFPGYECNIRCFQNVAALCLQGLMTRRAIFSEVGGFDSRFSSEIGTAEYCVRVREAGYRLVTMSTVKLKVDETMPSPRYASTPNAPDYSAADLAVFDAKWPGLRARGMACYNRNLDQNTGYQQVPSA